MNLLVTVSRAVADAFVAGLWQGMVLVALVALVLRMMPRLGAAARFAVWGLAFAAAVAVPFVRFSGQASGVGSVGVRVGVGWGLAIATCWALLTLVRLGRLLAQGLQLRGIWKEATPVEVGGAIARLLAEMPRKPVLCTSSAVDAPSVIGFWSPKLLIPEWQMGSLNEGEMRQIVLHECEHLRRRDDWMNLAQKIGLALFPLNPALLWADRRLSLERELACDAGVIARTRAPFDYAECLTRLAEQRLGRRSLALALSAWSRNSELVRRVHRLLRPVGSMGQVQRRVSLGVLAMLVAGGSAELARMPRLVSFADPTPVREAGAQAILVGRMPGATGGRMMPVVYREPARMDRPIRTMPVKAGKRTRHRAAAKQELGVWRNQAVKAERTAVFPAKARVMLTSAEVNTDISPAEDVRFRLVDAVSTEGTGTYAAVPFANGWLIIQL